jgi:hypothetical protein
MRDAKLRAIIEGSNKTWKALALREQGIKSGLISKY